MMNFVKIGLAFAVAVSAKWNFGARQTVSAAGFMERRLDGEDDFVGWTGEEQKATVEDAVEDGLVNLVSVADNQEMAESTNEYVQKAWEIWQVIKEKAESAAQRLDTATVDFKKITGEKWADVTVDFVEEVDGEPVWMKKFFSDYYLGLINADGTIEYDVKAKSMSLEFSEAFSQVESIWVNFAEFEHDGFLKIGMNLANDFYDDGDGKVLVFGDNGIELVDQVVAHCEHGQVWVNDHCVTVSGQHGAFDNGEHNQAV